MYAKCGEIIYDENGKVKEVIKDWCDWGVGNEGYIFYDAEAYNTSMDRICYVPEFGNNEDSFYTHEKLLELAGGNEDLARLIFEMVDWQSPETLLLDLEEAEVVFYCNNCGTFNLTELKNEADICIHCGASQGTLISLVEPE